MVLASQSQLLRGLFLSQHNFEFSIIDWEKSIAQLTGRRASDQMLEIILPDFEKQDMKRLLDCFYKGEMLIDDEVNQS